MNSLFLKFKRDPAGFIGRALYKTVVAPLKYWRKGGYDANRYWRDRFAKHGMSLKSVGDEGLSDEENLAMYQQAARALLELCVQEGIDFARARVLEIGCGNGFYTQLLREQGVKHYLGVDITDVFFPQLAQRFPGFQFVRQDITAEAVAGEFDLILMIDVIEHIVGENELDAAMKHVEHSLAPGGLFLVAPVSEKGRRSLFYVRFWSMQDIKQRFPGFLFRDQLPFRYSHLLSIKKPPAGSTTAASLLP